MCWLIIVVLHLLSRQHKLESEINQLEAEISDKVSPNHMCVHVHTVYIYVCALVCTFNLHVNSPNVFIVLHRFFK